MWCSRITNLLLFLIVCVWGSSATGDVRPSVVKVDVGEGFLIRLLEDTARSVPLQNCQLTRNNKLYLLAPGQNKTYTLSTGELVQPFDYNNTYECGVRVFDVGLLSNGQWKLSSIDEQGKERSGTTEVKITSEVGCPIINTKDCRLLGLDNNFLGFCDKTIADTLSYKCDFFADGRMSRQSFLAGKKETPSPYLKTQTGSTVLDCRHQISSEQQVTACHIEHVYTKTKYFIQEGLLDKRFSAYKTDFVAGICQFEFLGEISENETGTWTMSMEIMTKRNNPRYNNYYNDGYDYQRFIYTNETKTCKFRLKGNETLGLQKIMLRTNSTEVIKTMENTATIECANNVFYPITVCYLLTQEGDILFSKDSVSFADGNCGFVVPAGNWTCGFNGPKEGNHDFVQNFEVIQYEKEIIDEKAKVAEDGSVSIECHLIYKNQVKVCMLVSPSGIVFRPPTDQFKSEEFSYYGGGSLNTGDCGITISKEAEVESGFWKCLIVKMNDEQLTTQIFVPEEVDNSH